jgi:hypothetical protein
MMKLLLALASTALLATPVLACPNHDDAAPQAEKKTASDKTDAKKPATTATTKQAPASAPKATDKPADKVSSR